jgi:hypothetical protein
VEEAEGGVALKGPPAATDRGGDVVVDVGEALGANAPAFGSTTTALATPAMNTRTTRLKAIVAPRRWLIASR